jgi:pimeloyl-ACP methyl ester carboxylesterase
VFVSGTPSADPQRDGVVTLADGRRVSYAEWGPSNGRPVVLLHGMPGSRRFCPDVVATEAAGVRLLALDRPGYGGSTPKRGRTLLSWADDFAQWADAIGLAPGAVIGWSSGGPYALACALRCPDRITGIGLASSVAPLDEVPDGWASQSEDVRTLTERVRRDMNEARDGVAARCEWFTDGWQSFVEPVGSNPDDVLLADNVVFASMRESMREAARQGTAGYVDDWIAESLPWKFSPAAVQHEVHIWWGTEDDVVPRAHAETLASTLPRSRLEIIPGQGHLLVISHWADMLAALA